MTMAVLTRTYLWLAYSFRGLVHYRPGGWHNCMQADTGLEEELRILPLDLHQQEERDPGPSPTPSDTFLQQGHTF